MKENYNSIKFLNKVYATSSKGFKKYVNPVNRSIDFCQFPLIPLHIQKFWRFFL